MFQDVFWFAYQTPRALPHTQSCHICAKIYFLLQCNASYSQIYSIIFQFSKLFLSKISTLVILLLESNCWSCSCHSHLCCRSLNQCQSLVQMLISIFLRTQTKVITIFHERLFVPLTCTYLLHCFEDFECFLVAKSSLWCINFLAFQLFITQEDWEFWVSI